MYPPPPVKNHCFWCFLMMIFGSGRLFWQILYMYFFHFQRWSQQGILLQGTANCANLLLWGRSLGTQGLHDRFHQYDREQCHRKHGTPCLGVSRFVVTFFEVRNKEICIVKMYCLFVFHSIDITGVFFLVSMQAHGCWTTVRSISRHPSRSLVREKFTEEVEMEDSPIVIEFLLFIFFNQIWQWCTGVRSSSRAHPSTEWSRFSTKFPASTGILCWSSISLHRNVTTRPDRWSFNHFLN